jgi:NAD(P)-dependent dehydrogenase (short-subunit alcohol dehydrogenase family)
MRRPLSDSVVVITGASSGIGRATALAFAAAGAKVVLAARREEPLREAAADCEARGAEALAVPTDVRDEAAVRRLAAAADERFGGVDVWVSNAGVTLLGRFEDTPAELWREVVETNFFGAVNGARAALPALRRRGAGTLINVGSVNSRVGAPYASAYVASKFALRGFAECLRDEVRGDGIAVCTVMPASIDTPLFQHAANFAGRPIKPLRPILRPERVAAAIVRCARRPRREVVVGLSGRQLIVLHDLALPLFERIMSRNVDREHFLQRPAEPTAGNLREPVPEWTGVTGGWKDGDASPTGAGPAADAMGAPSGA